MKPRLARSGLLRESFGKRPYTVQLVEREPGGNVSLCWGKPRVFESLGYAVREVDSRKRWRWDDRLLSTARAAAEDRSATLRLGQLRQSVSPEALTLGEAWALFMDEERGGLPDSDTARRNYRISEEEWTTRLGTDTPWNKITPADIEGIAFRVKAAAPAKADMMVKNLRAVFNWLVRKRRMRHLENPLGDDFPWKELRQGVTPRQERYTPEEQAKLLAVRDEIDPRFALMVVLATQTGARSKALRLWMRSQLDVPLRPAPTPDMAPHGWTLLPALKGQDAPLVMLTRYARSEINKALAGYLSDLEAEYQRSGRDYPMIPGARIGDAIPQVVRLDQSGAYRPVGSSDPKKWLADAERKAKVAHVESRSWHGIRRLWTDEIEDEAGMDVAAVAGQWADRTMVERVYRSKRQYKKLARARQVLDAKDEAER